jgi:hypothetical protein
MKSFEIHAASGHSGTDEIPEVPLARRCLDALKADGKNPDLDELTEAIFQRHGIRLNKFEVARQLDARRQGHSKTSAKAHDASCKAAEASDRARNIGEGDDPAELHACAQTAHEEAARAHWTAVHYHGRAATYHGEKVKNSAVEISEPEDNDEPEAGD